MPVPRHSTCNRRCLQQQSQANRSRMPTSAGRNTTTECAPNHRRPKLTHPTFADGLSAQRLRSLRLHGMADAYAEQSDHAEVASLSFDERLGLPVDREANRQKSRRLTSRLRRARLRQSGANEDIDYASARGLEKSFIRSRDVATSPSIRTSSCQLSPRQAALLVLRRDPGANDKQKIERILATHVDLEEAVVLSQAFTHILREWLACEFDAWLDRATQSPLTPFRRFAKSLNRDYEAVKASFELPWSTSPIEGHINKLKMYRRQLYGWAKFDLLEKRLLYQIS